MYNLKTTLSRKRCKSNFSYILRINSELVKYKPGIVLFLPQALKLSLRKLCSEIQYYKRRRTEKKIWRKQIVSGLHIICAMLFVSEK